ncbi:N-acetylglucosamine kinase [Myroides sp. JBRI-B21084]|uniref:N-acetylglucosamine kinase n=1 Tax=Myroides sp. JBRI-B21084 TaxID=3119977 RepID=UPI0026E3DE1E|nr:N-acetylglucosamine kinase [Paenimyroides cloacae]WKW45713.1 N-acetylglucosamine kinase [Paenimyroides cloacae]
MKFVVDSGSTKADWLLFNNKQNLGVYNTLGLNPEVLTTSVLTERILCNEEIANLRTAIKEVYFYGSGCSTPHSKETMLQALKNVFENAVFFKILEDTYAAVYATCADLQPGIVCINGTGSNCSYFNGNTVEQAVESLGYLAMDDCSGVEFGRNLIRAYYFNSMPKDLKSKFEEDYNLDADFIKRNFYKEPNPNAYLASFLPFLIANKQHDFLQEMITKSFQFFIDHYIKQYENYLKVPVHFIGSTAYLLQDEFKRILEKNNLKAGVFFQKPLDGLIEFHKK